MNIKKQICIINVQNIESLTIQISINLILSNMMTIDKNVFNMNFTKNTPNRNVRQMNVQHQGKRSISESD